MPLESYSQDPLAWLTEVYGPDLDRLEREPALVAAVDQHAAAVRDRVPLDPGHLADYLIGFLDELHAQGWRPHDAEPYPEVRLLALCWLAEQVGILPAGGSPA
ncbi:DUF6401 family natural product biosynthesis protein [Streptacidiphilus griseoplanus]|uniref:DUF6401 family natural product biosynthesis protein n=1 Tax=Peterkaempfera griseoplana TaxID=66896 RepID=UPI0006E37C1F|nr:DUF6401 family natural product biosynthesis protein [Peterkaempfera griseoplana]